MSVELIGEDVPLSPKSVNNRTSQVPSLGVPLNDTTLADGGDVSTTQGDGRTTSARAKGRAKRGNGNLLPGYILLVLLDGSTVCLDATTGDTIWALQGQGVGGPLVCKTEKFARSVQARADAQAMQQQQQQADNNDSSGNTFSSSSSALVATPRSSAASMGSQKQQQQPTSLVSHFVAGFGTSRDSIFLRKDGELTPADEFRRSSSYIHSGDYFVTNSVDHIYLEVRLSDGDVLCRGMDDQLASSTGGTLTGAGSYDLPTSPPSTPTAPSPSFPVTAPVGPVIALLRTNKTMKGRKKNFVSWSFTTGDVNITLLSTSTPTSAFGSGNSPLPSGTPTTNFSPRRSGAGLQVVPQARVFVTGEVEVFTAGGEFLWECNVGNEIVKAYQYCDVCPLSPSTSTTTPTSSHRSDAFDAVVNSGPLREVKVSVCGGADEQRSSMLYNEGTSFIFTKGETPPMITVSGLEDGGSHPVLLDANAAPGPMLVMTGGGGMVQSVATTTTGMSLTPLSGPSNLMSPSVLSATQAGSGKVGSSGGSNLASLAASPGAGSGGGGWNGNGFDGVDDTTVGSRSDSDEDCQSQTTEVPSVLTPAQSHFANNFLVEGLLGQGADGVVMLCKHKVTHLRYAVKVVPVRDQASEDGVFREVRLLARLQHTNIVRFFSVWTEEVSNATNNSHHQHQTLSYNNRAIHAPAPSSAQEGYLRQALLAQAGNRQLAIGPGPNGNLLLGDFPSTQTKVGSHSDDEDTTDYTNSQTTANTEDIHGPVTKTMFIQMEYCHTTLAHWMNLRKGISREDNLNVTAQLVDGLKYLHQEGVIHRDLKPANVLLLLKGGLTPTSTAGASRKPSNQTRSGHQGDQELIVKLGDFGLAKLPSMSRDHEAHHDPETVLSAFEVRHNAETHTQGVGTPLYAAPEQRAGKACSPEGDIYSLGMLLLEMYILPSTASERIHFMTRIQEGRGIDPTLLEQYPELEVALNMVHQDPTERPSLATLKKLIKHQRSTRK